MCGHDGSIMPCITSAFSLMRGQVQDDCVVALLSNDCTSTCSDDATEQCLTLQHNEIDTIDSALSAPLCEKSGSLTASSAVYKSGLSSECISRNVPLSEPDLYGQRHPIESATLIQHKLQEFDACVERLVYAEPAHLSAALVQAKTHCPKLVDNNAFKLRFLRCECFDAKKAAVRCAKYWTKRVELFTSQRAFAPLQLSTLTDDEIRAVRVGAIQIVHRPKSNQTTMSTKQDDCGDYLFFDPSRLDATQYSRESAICAFWYLFDVLLQDEQVQRRGVIIVNWCGNINANSNKHRDPRLVRLCITSVLGILPMRISAYHLCAAPTWCRLVARVVSSVVGERLRRRLIVHAGTTSSTATGAAAAAAAAAATAAALDDDNLLVQTLEEVYSIPRSSLPREMGGRLALNVDAWMKSRKQLESKSEW